MAAPPAPGVAPPPQVMQQHSQSSYQQASTVYQPVTLAQLPQPVTPGYRPLQTETVLVANDGTQFKVSKAALMSASAIVNGMASSSPNEQVVLNFNNTDPMNARKSRLGVQIVIYWVERVAAGSPTSTIPVPLPYKPMGELIQRWELDLIEGVACPRGDMTKHHALYDAVNIADYLQIEKLKMVGTAYLAAKLRTATTADVWSWFNQGKQGDFSEADWDKIRETHQWAATYRRRNDTSKLDEE